MPNLNTFAPAVSEGKAFHDLPVFNNKHKVCIVGAGAFGGWTSLFLKHAGYDVTLIDTWGAGNSRSSSGDETRVIRSTYGGNEIYFQLNVRALELWKVWEKKFSAKVFFNTGVLWLCHNEKTPVVDLSIPFSKKYSMEYEHLSPSEISKRYPQIRSNDLHHAYFDPYGGYLKAREATQRVLEEFITAGGNYILAKAKPGKIENKGLSEIVLENGTSISADVFIFACGSWLPTLFPEVLKEKIFCTRQEVYYFGTPSATASSFDSLPVWIDADGQDYYYGIPGNNNRGFKVGVDRRGVAFDPSTGDHRIDEAVLSHARNFLGHRFPGMMDAPLLENRVCPYENSQSGNFIFDLHPGTENLFFLGGGSGHGFKHGPALGELIADSLSGEKRIPGLFRIF